MNTASLQIIVPKDINRTAILAACTEALKQAGHSAGMFNGKPHFSFSAMIDASPTSAETYVMNFMAGRINRQLRVVLNDQVITKAPVQPHECILTLSVGVGLQPLFEALTSVFIAPVVDDVKEGDNLPKTVFSLLASSF